MASDITLSSISRKRERQAIRWRYAAKSVTMAPCLLCALLTLSPPPYTSARAVASQPLGVIAAGKDPPSVQQIRIDQLRQELKMVQKTLGDKKLNANERTFYENKRKTLQAELDSLAPEQKPVTKKAGTKKPNTEGKTDTKNPESAKGKD